MPIALAVHGGAWNIPDRDVESHRAGVEAALRLGWDLLRKGRRSLDVVEAVVVTLENDPTFNAGRGSHLNRVGRVELDASIMDGASLRVGAVAAVEGIRNPVSLARLVLAKSPHVLLSGKGARLFARQQGVPSCATPSLLVGRELERYRRIRDGDRRLVTREFHDPHGTVGAVALDRRGHVAAATSTGGTQDKAPGRIGDTPIPGAGTWADDRTGAASCTGLGESILRTVLAKTAVDALGDSRSPATAGSLAIRTLARVRGRAGLILVDRFGRAAARFNTPRMARGIATEDEGTRVAVLKKEHGL